MHAGLEPKMATIMEQVRKGLVAKISEEERNGYIEAMKANKVPEWYIRVTWEGKYMFLSHAAAHHYSVALRVTLQGSPSIYYTIAYFSIRAKALISRLWGRGLDAIKHRMEEPRKTEEQWSL